MDIWFLLMEMFVHDEEVNRDDDNNNDNNNNDVNSK